MDISDEFKLKSESYIRTQTNKKQIVLGNTYSNSMNHLKSQWRNGGKFNKFPHFSIDVSGKVYQHFDVKYFSLYLDCKTDEQVITIGLENIGQLFKHGDSFYDIYNNLYTEDIHEQTWKNVSYWQPYTNNQLNSTIELCRYLFNETNIPNQASDINVYKQDIISFKGVCYRSNHHMKHYDVNPSWDFEKFKNAIENG